ncbi:SPOR domain-containing protein [Candidatus Sumerlaeota bacterium]|nr:SPOR domain-containing protein [Candidatus Sumerlaeota bacterium]
MSRPSILSLILALALGAAVGAQTTLGERVVPEHIYWVEAGHFTDADLAATLRQDLLSRGYSPVHVVTDELAQWHSVRVGGFPILADAHLLFEDMRADYPGARLVDADLLAERLAGREWAFEPVTAPVSPREIFNLSERPLTSDVPLRFDNEAAAIADGGQLLDPVNPELDSEVEQEAVELTVLAKDADDPARGLAYFVLADVRAGRGELREALDIAMQVATESLAASPQKRYEAMWLVARIHHGIDERMTAYRAYREIEPFINDDRDLARCLVEQQGLLVELVTHHGTGTRLCGRIRGQEILDRFGDSTDPEVRHRCATAASMLAQSHWEDDPQLCIDLMHEFIEHCGEFRRETSIAYLFIGRCNRGLGNLAEARAGYEAVLNMGLEEGEHFPNIRHDEEAAGWLAHICRQMGDHEAADYYDRYRRNIGNPRSQVSQSWGQGYPSGPPTPPR